MGHRKDGRGRGQRLGTKRHYASKQLGRPLTAKWISFNFTTRLIALSFVCLPRFILP